MNERNCKIYCQIILGENKRSAKSEGAQKQMIHKKKTNCNGNEGK